MSRFSWVTQLGIVPRLATAFLAVALLAVAANTLSQLGPQIILLGREPASSVTTARRPEISTDDALASSTPPIMPIETGKLLAATERHARATRSRADTPGTALDADLAAAAKALNAEMTKIQKSADNDGRPLPVISLRKQIRRQQTDAKALIAAADERRTAITRYRDAFEQLDGTIKQEIDRAWKILGRVIARQSLIDLSRKMDSLRPMVGKLTGPEPADSAIIASTEVEEASISAELRSGSATQTWRLAVQARFDEMLSARRDLQEFDLGFRRQRTNFTTHAEQARASAQKLQDASARIPPAASAASSPMGANVGIEDEAGIASYAESRLLAPYSPIVQEALFPAPVRSRDHGRRLLIWISGGVMLILLVICVGTVISIVRPVNRLMAATRRLAAGDLTVQVPRGGTRELDALGSAFNQMAERLAAAQALVQQYNSALESRVEERTRQLQHLAEHDPLTQLPNRRQFFVDLDRMLDAAAKTDGACVGILFLDLDNFKTINDSMGHLFGDRVLQRLATRLVACSEAFGVTDRLGGDEFTVLVSSAQSPAEILAAAQTIIESFHAPLSVDGMELALSASLGISIYPDHEGNAQALLRAADAAVFEAKSLGRNRIAVFHPELLKAAESRFATEQGLRGACERNEFELFFQPEVCLETGQVNMVEALLRWRLPDGSCVLPGEFLEVAEESGLINRISEWVVMSALETIARWRTTHWPEARVAINVSARQLLDSGFVEMLQELAQRYCLPPECIEIELTENVLQTGVLTIECLRRLRTAGFGIALDDFGTGYSSLASLEQLPLTRVKLDRSLMASIDTNPRSLAIARAIISMCQGLGLAITAEGVERPEQLLPLVNKSGIFIQGFLLSPALPAAAFIGSIESLSERFRETLGIHVEDHLRKTG
jgi:diguanylate cyclase (GGDEF)-like protein